MQSNRFIQSIRLSGFLSFGSAFQTVELQPLNVLIGPNASGKSNFLELFRVLKAIPDNIANPIHEGGGIAEYLCKGSSAQATLNIEATIDWKEENSALQYLLEISNDQSWLKIIAESIKPVAANHINNFPISFYTSTNRGRGKLARKTENLFNYDETESQQYMYTDDDVSPNSSRSILSQYKDPKSYPSLAYLQGLFTNIQFYSGWDSGRFGSLRHPQKADIPSGSLLEDGSNLGLVLINKPSNIKQQITEKLRLVLPTIEEIFPKIEGGSVPLYIREKGFSTPTPASRLSEGTLRYLCLLTLLLDPTPPPIICLEEPEAGLHPHVVSQIAELLIDASQRTQLIVTTHSDALISGLSECPEAIITCERDDEGTKLRRLDPEQIKPWLDRYALGDLWRMGEIGGVR